MQLERLGPGLEPQTYVKAYAGSRAAARAICGHPMASRVDGLETTGRLTTAAVLREAVRRGLESIVDELRDLEATGGAR